LSIPSHQKSQKTQSSHRPSPSFLHQSRQLSRNLKSNTQRIQYKDEKNATLAGSNQTIPADFQSVGPSKGLTIAKDQSLVSLESINKTSENSISSLPLANLTADDQEMILKSKEDIECIPSLFDEKSKAKTHSESSTDSSVSDQFDDDSFFIQHPIFWRKSFLVFLLIMCAFITFFLILMLGLCIGAAIRGESISLKSIFSPGSNTRLQQNIASPSSPAPTPTINIADTSAPAIASSSRQSSPPSNLLDPSHFPTLKPGITVGAYYYPWHGKHFHNGQGYLRRELNQSPKLGEYDDTDPSIIGQHLAWSRQANIGLWISSWWGPNRLEDNTTRNVILTHQDLGDHKIALFYETSGRIKEENNFDVSNVELDVNHMCKHYFDHPNYFRIDGRPVLFMYLTRKLEATGKFEEAILLMRSLADNCGHDLYIAGDHAFATPPSEDKTYRPFLYLDAVTNYDVYGSMRTTGYAGQEVVDEYYNNQKRWRKEASNLGCGYIPAVSPGYNDRGVRLEADHEPLSRRLSRTASEGSLFKAGLQLAKYLVDETAGNLLVVNSFNEWHEDSQIEPAVGDTTDEPFEMTIGLDYEGYDEIYLDILREETFGFNPYED
jgi:glycoprotein endo-alpha-1,2-mannosidase